MKLEKIFLMLILFVACFNNPINAGVKIKGDYIVTLTNDTISVVFKTAWGDKLVCMVEGVKTKFAVKDISSYKSGNNIYESAFVAQEENGEKKWCFLRREDHKKLTILILYETVKKYPSGSYTAEHYFCRKPKDPKENLVAIYKLTDLCEVCSDCPKLVEQLKSKNPAWELGTYNALLYYFDNQNCN